jgi:hypothetical protein
MKEKQIVLSDHIGRIVAGTLVEETDIAVVVRNPVIVHVEPQPQTGQLSVHTYPYIFMEFVSPDTRESNNWTFSKSSVAISNIDLDERLSEAVRNINTPKQPGAVGPVPGDSKIVNLFDNE